MYGTLVSGRGRNGDSGTRFIGGRECVLYRYRRIERRKSERGGSLLRDIPSVIKKL